MSVWNFLAITAMIAYLPVAFLTIVWVWRYVARWPNSSKRAFVRGAVFAVLLGVIPGGVDSTGFVAPLWMWVPVAPLIAAVGFVIYAGLIGVLSLFLDGRASRRADSGSVPKESEQKGSN